MTNWKQGGWTGSLNAWVKHEIQDHFRTNAAARRNRYAPLTRLIHGIFDNATFGRVIALYASIALLIGVAEIALAAHLPQAFFGWTGTNEVKSLLTNVASYLITAQVGVLGVVSIAIGLVTIIAQRENASTDVQVYYHESLAFGIVASSIALIVVLCAQLLWPVQSTLHWLGFGTGLQLFKLILTALHITWLILNLSATARFVATTLAFVQQKAREALRERYTTNVVLPLEMRKRLREQLYLGAGPELVKEFWPTATKGWKEPTVWLGTNFSNVGEVEIPFTPGNRIALYDVRMAWVRWAVGRWLTRCQSIKPDQNKKPIGGLSEKPFLVFPSRLDDTAEIHSGLCRRRGGVPLDWLEKVALRWAFKFTRTGDDA
ncbi:hypothetical protein BjapCC829_23690 [Bradyrhizobium barranii]|uniref:DUF2254 domain-containing protein n=1 Tax=Bradyrhizobium barranii TaxID=2992140 RepID=A0ABY3QBG2_9BRAD|nr:hypothetical protein [Bradyrhizobium japonicum]UFW82991.1 hypothetical protein BjapCC829_23690 [Bradyrhizobium japonicum]